MTTENWWQSIEAVIEKHSLLKHPFYQAWQAGRLSLDDLRYYAIQYYPHVANFPEYVKIARTKTKDIKMRQMLTDNLREELNTPKETATAYSGGEGSGPDNHPELWLRFAEGLGLTRGEVLGAAIAPETKECVETFLKLSRDANPLGGVAALYAYESQIPEISNTKIHGLKEFYGISDRRSLAFFDRHCVADVWHSQEEREAIQETARSKKDRQIVKQSVEAACRAVWRLLDGVVEARQLCVNCR